MEQRYLPSTPQQRLQDLMKEHKITQTVLAKKIGVTESTLSRLSTVRRIRSAWIR